MLLLFFLFSLFSLFIFDIVFPFSCSGFLNLFFLVFFLFFTFLFPFLIFSFFYLFFLFSFFLFLLFFLAFFLFSFFILIGVRSEPAFPLRPLRLSFIDGNGFKREIQQNLFLFSSPLHRPLYAVLSLSRFSVSLPVFLSFHPFVHHFIACLRVISFIALVISFIGLIIRQFVHFFFCPSVLCIQ